MFGIAERKEFMDKKEIVYILQDVIILHESMRGAYFFQSPRVAAQRRRYEEKHSLETAFEFEGMQIEIKQITNCSCNNIYYCMKIYIDGTYQKKDIRFVKGILKKLQE